MAAAIVAWLILLVAGMLILTAYSNGAGEPGRTPLSWPRDSSISRSPGVTTIVMFAHPNCPCTRASVRELARTLALIRGELKTHVLFFAPSGEVEGGVQTGLYREASSIPGVNVAADPDGREADLFSVRTSGHVVLYGPEGDLLFSGGITAGRGHEGDNSGASSVVELCRDVLSRTERTAPVFGCTIREIP